MDDQEYKKIIEHLENKDPSPDLPSDEKMEDEKQLFHAMKKGIEAFGERQLKSELDGMRSEFEEKQKKRTRMRWAAAASVAIIMSIIVFKPSNTTDEMVNEPTVESQQAPIEFHQHVQPQFSDSAIYKEEKKLKKSVDE